MRYVMAAIALLTCPCHLPIVLILLSGTALGAVLDDHWVIALVALTAAFVASAWVAIRLFHGEAEKSGTSRH